MARSFAVYRPPDIETEQASYEIRAAPGSMYPLRGPARWAYQHQVVPVWTERYSLTFRHVAEGANG